jgi:uncharacterized protein (DUF2147 family)
MSSSPSHPTRRLASHNASWRAGLAGVLVSLAPAALAQTAPPPAPPSGSAAPETPVAGVWFDDTARGAVELRPCPTGLCGHIVWLKEPTDATGAPRTDAYNPDPSKRSRPICGLQVIGNVKQQSDGTWDQGWVYDPKAGKAYDVAIEMPARDRLTVTGYKGIKLLSKTLEWTRAPADLPRCTPGKEASGTGARIPQPRRP